MPRTYAGFCKKRRKQGRRVGRIRFFPNGTAYFYATTPRGWRNCYAFLDYGADGAGIYKI